MNGICCYIDIATLQKVQKEIASFFPQNILFWSLKQTLWTLRTNKQKLYETYRKKQAYTEQLKTCFLTHSALCFSGHHCVRNKESDTRALSLNYVRMYQISVNHPMRMLLQYSRSQSFSITLLRISSTLEIDVNTLITICRANQWSGFSIIETSVMEELKTSKARDLETH